MSDNAHMTSGETCTHEEGACASCGTSGCSQREAASTTLPQQDDLSRTLDQIRHTIIVLSGKGGVGKSTVAVNTAVGLAAEGHRVGP